MTRHATPADYVRLGLPRDATPAEIKTAFRKLALQYHPDRNPGDEEAVKRFKAIAESYDALINGGPPPRHPVGRSGSVPAQPHPQAARARHRPTGPHIPVPPPAYSPRSHRPAHHRPATRPLSALLVGDRVFTEYAAILVGPDRTCYLDPAAIGRSHVDGGALVRVERADEGYNVVIPAHCRHRWSVSTQAPHVGLTVHRLAVDGDGLAHNPLLPARFVDSTVARMTNGARGWTVAHALVVTPAGRILIDGTEQVAPSPGLTTPVRVERRVDGWHVVAPGHPQQWVNQGRPFSHAHLDVTSAVLGGVPVAGAAARA